MLGHIIPAAKAAASFLAKNPSITTGIFRFGKTIYYAATSSPTKPSPQNTRDSSVYTEQDLDCPMCDGTGKLVVNRPDPQSMN